LGTEILRRRRQEADEADEQKRRRIMLNEGRRERIEQRIMDEGELRKFLELFLPRIKRICLVCLLLDEVYDDHDLNSCERIKKALKKVGVESWQKAKRGVYDANSCCYRCSRPSEMCDMAQFGLSQSCSEPDVIFPTVMMGWLDEDMRMKDIVEEVAGRKIRNVHDLLKCMGGRHFEKTLQAKGTKIYAGWVRIMSENKEKLERELGEEDMDIDSDLRDYGDEDELSDELSEESEEDLYG